MEGPGHSDLNASEASTVTALGSIIERLSILALTAGQDAMERELLREVVGAGLASAAGLWTRAHDDAPWLQVRGFGGETPPPDRSLSGPAGACVPLAQHRRLVTRCSLLNHEANTEALELLAAAIGLICDGASEDPPPLPSSGAA